MMHHLKLIKALSYSGAVHATKDKPDVFVEDETKYQKAMKSGYFKEISEESVEEAQKIVHEDAEEASEPSGIDAMDINELKVYAEIGGISITGLKKKADILSAIKNAEAKADEARQAIRNA